MVIIASLFEKRAAGVYHNTAAVIDADGALARHLPQDAHSGRPAVSTRNSTLRRATSVFAPGRRAHGEIGVCVCWDQWYPEAARLTALQGADILFYPTAIGWHPSEKAEHGGNQHSAWETIQRSHAVANGCYVAAVNRVGLEKPRAGTGLNSGAKALSPAPPGKSWPRPAPTRRKSCWRRWTLSQVDVTRTHWPFLRDRRIDAYGDLTKRWID